MSDFNDKSRLASIRKSISDMTDEELKEAIGLSRNNRSVPAQKKTSTKKKKVTKKKSPISLLDNIGDLSPEAAQALLKQLGKDD